MAAETVTLPIDVQAIEGLDEVASPALLVFEERVKNNLVEMVRVAGDAGRLRPHCKTHKMVPIIQMELDLGIDKHKCATIAEAEMLADCGVRDVFWAYPPVGPNISRLLKLIQQYPDTQFSVTADSIAVVEPLAKAAAAADCSIGVLLDLDPGMHRTGVEPGPDAIEVYRSIDTASHLVPSGLHWYDGHNRQMDYAERCQAVHAGYQKAAALADELEAAGLPVPRIVVGGTGSFPCFAELDDQRLELSPGTTVFHDMGYARAFPEMQYEPAAWLLTRVISRPTPQRITFDLGHKACAADPPAEKRVYFPSLPDAKIVMQNEEHLVLELPSEASHEIGQPLLAISHHICPTTAAHQEVIVVRDGVVAGRWEVASRNRRITI